MFVWAVAIRVSATTTVPQQRKWFLRRNCDPCGFVATSREARITLSEETWTQTDGDDGDVSERERGGFEQAAAASTAAAAQLAAESIQTPAPVADAQSPRRIWWTARLASAGVDSATPATERRDDSDRCSPTTQAFDWCRRAPECARPQTRTRPSWATDGRLTAAGRDVASTTTAENAVPDRRVRRYRDRSLPRWRRRRLRCRRSVSTGTC